MRRYYVKYLMWIRLIASLLHYTCLHIACSTLPYKRKIKFDAQLDHKRTKIYAVQEQFEIGSLKITQQNFTIRILRQSFSCA